IKCLKPLFIRGLLDTMQLEYNGLILGNA
ncbi:MAG: hypothetical protein RL655_2126, partial [Pseudomonadota bacterium]